MLLILHKFHMLLILHMFHILLILHRFHILLILHRLHILLISRASVTTKKLSLFFKHVVNSVLKVLEKCNWILTAQLL